MDSHINLGMHPKIVSYIQDNQLTSFSIGRVIAQFKDQYRVLKPDLSIAEAEITGNLRYSAGSQRDFPAVGDWVTMIPYDTSYIIHQVLPRISYLERKAVSGQSESQLIATNLDYAFIVQALNQDFNLNRLERYLVMVHGGHIQPIVLLNKADLNTEAENHDKISEIKTRIGDEIPVWLLSAETDLGIQAWKNSLIPSKSYCFVGSSGVGKSTLINLLLENDSQNTAKISSATQKGKHTTTSREMFFTPGGSILVDSPGMRSLGVLNDELGMNMTFAKILELAAYCRFADCKHLEEPGCAVRAAVEDGSLEASMLENYHKLQRESDHFSQSVAEKRRYEKSFAKIIREATRHRRNRKY